MKTSELIQKIEEMGLKVSWGISGMLRGNFVYYGASRVATICEDYPYRISNETYDMLGLPEDKQKQLFELLVEYARTPIEERKERPENKGVAPEIPGQMDIEDYRR